MLVFLHASEPTVAIVTGGSRGIGAAIVKALAANGYSVAINFVVDEASARKVVAQLSASGFKAVAVRADVSRESDVLKLFETAEGDLGLIGVLVNNAGITGGFSRVDSVHAGALVRMLSVKCRGSHYLCARSRPENVDAFRRPRRRDHNYFIVSRAHRGRW